MSCCQIPKNGRTLRQDKLPFLFGGKEERNNGVNISAVSAALPLLGHSPTASLLQLAWLGPMFGARCRWANNAAKTLLSCESIQMSLHASCLCMMSFTVCRLLQNAVLITRGRANHLQTGQLAKWTNG